jgi:hypothetical protein
MLIQSELRRRRKFKVVRVLVLNNPTASDGGDSKSLTQLGMLTGIPAAVHFVAMVPNDSLPEFASSSGSSQSSLGSFQHEQLAAPTGYGLAVDTVHVTNTHSNRLGPGRCYTSRHRHAL